MSHHESEERHHDEDHIPHNEHEYHSSSSSEAPSHEREQHDDDEHHQQHIEDHDDNQEQNDPNLHDQANTPHHHSRSKSKESHESKNKDDGYVDEVHEKSNEPTPCNSEDENYVNTKQSESQNRRDNENEEKENGVHIKEENDAVKVQEHHDEKFIVNGENKTECNQDEKNATNEHKVHGKKHKKQTPTRVVNIGNVLRIPAIPEGVNSPRSLKLCAQHKINPRELSRHTIEDFMGPNVPAELADLRHRSYVKRQHEHMVKLQGQYQELLEKEEAEKAAAEEAEANNEARKQRLKETFQQRKMREMIEAGMKAHKPIVHKPRHSLLAEEEKNKRCARKKEPYRAEKDEELSRIKERRQIIERQKLEEQVDMLRFKDMDISAKTDEHFEAENVFSALHQKKYMKEENLHYTELMLVAQNAVHESVRRYKSPKRAGDLDVLKCAAKEFSTPREQRRSPSPGSAENE